jgi:hypothetical protein
MVEKHKNITHYIQSPGRGPNQDSLDMNHGCRLLTVTFGDTNTIKLTAVPHVHVFKFHFSSVQDHCERPADTVWLVSSSTKMSYCNLEGNLHSSMQGCNTANVVCWLKTFIPAIIIPDLGHSVIIFIALDINFQHHSKLTKTWSLWDVILCLLVSSSWCFKLL